MKECDVAWFDIDSLDRPLIINPNGVIEEFVDKQTLSHTKPIQSIKRFKIDNLSISTLAIQKETLFNLFALKISRSC